MLELSKLKTVPGARKHPKRVGRGPGSGIGKTCGRGQKGQKSRSGGNPHPWFEGGQMPLYRRVPKRGFKNLFRKEYQVVNLKQLARLSGEGPITPEVMKEKGLIRKPGPVKVLGEGELAAGLTVHAQKFSDSAKTKIEQSGGKAIIL